MLHVPVIVVVNLSIFFKTKLLAIIVFGPELALHNVFPLLTTNLCSTIAFILLSAYAFYLDQFEIHCVVKSTSNEYKVANLSKKKN